MHSPTSSGFEPSLTEALDDPIIQKLMTSDGVSRTEVLRLMSLAEEAAHVRDGHPGIPPLSPQ